MVVLLFWKFRYKSLINYWWILAYQILRRCHLKILHFQGRTPYYWFCSFGQTPADAHENIIALKECLLEELEPAVGTSDITASGEGYDENLHSLMPTFWEMFDSGEITQNVTCTICSSVTTRVEPFSKLLLQFPESHHEATPMNWKCMLHSLIKHYHFGQEDLPNYDCQYCSERTFATCHVQKSWYPIILCIGLGYDFFAPIRRYTNTQKTVRHHTTKVLP